jgi:hypothetical protein
MKCMALRSESRSTDAKDRCELRNLFNLVTAIYFIPNVCAQHKHDAHTAASFE